MSPLAQYTTQNEKNCLHFGQILMLLKSDCLNLDYLINVDLGIEKNSSNYNDDLVRIYRIAKLFVVESTPSCRFTVHSLAKKLAHKFRDSVQKETTSLSLAIQACIPAR